MPTTNSAKKRMRQSTKARIQNLVVRTQVRSVRRSFFEAVAGKQKDVAEKLYRQYCSLLDKTAKKCVIKKNTASRRKTRAKAMLKTVQA